MLRPPWLRFALWLAAALSFADPAFAWPTPPTVAVTNPVGGVVVGGVIAVQAALSSSVGVSDVEFFVDGVSIGLDTTAPYLVGWNCTTATNGSHSLTAVAHDGVGGSVTSPAVVVSSVTPAFTDEVVVPNIAAAVTMVFLPDGRMLVGELTDRIWVVPAGGSAPLATSTRTRTPAATRRSPAGSCTAGVSSPPSTTGASSSATTCRTRSSASCSIPPGTCSA